MAKTVAMARTGRKSKSSASDINITFPTSWAELMRLIANNPGDSMAIVASLFVMLYMFPPTSSFAQPIVTITHNVTDPAELKDRGWICPASACLIVALSANNRL